MMGLWEGQENRPRPGDRPCSVRSCGADAGQCATALYRSGCELWHTGNRSPGFQPYDTFKCQDGWVFIGALGGQIFARVPKFLGLDPEVYTYEACSRDAAAMNSGKGREGDRRLRDYCAERTCREVGAALNKAQIGCARVFSTVDQYADPHCAAREMTVPALDRQSGVPVRVYGVVPKMSPTPGRIWRGACAVGEDTTDILSKLLGLSEGEIDGLYAEEVVHRTEPFTSPQVGAVYP
jgi:crotonobetainyl-CoA:carnitine CoA-transferase CaiB-like acyl-CoA transferase